MILHCGALGVRQFIAAFNDGIYSVPEKLREINFANKVVTGLRQEATPGTASSCTPCKNLGFLCKKTKTLKKGE
jgi:hypothetical protein